MGAPVLAALSGACAVLAAWDLLALLDHARAARLRARVLGPLRAARRSGREPTSVERRRLALTASATLLAGGWLAAGPIAGVLSGTAGPWAVAQVVAARRRRWRAELAASAPVVARAMADALAGGHSIAGALAAVADGGSLDGVPAGRLGAARRALALGEPVEAVLEDLRSDANGPQWDALVAAVSLQREAGGDLAELLRRLAAAQDEARRADGDARSLTAQARFTARLVAALPLGAAGLSELASPGYLASLAASPLTLLPAAAALVLLVTALVAVNRIARAGPW